MSLTTNVYDCSKSDYRNWRASKVICPTLMPAIGTKVEVMFGTSRGFLPGVVIGHDEQAPIVEFTMKNGKTRQGLCTVQVKGFRMYSEETGKGYIPIKYMAWIAE
jgi:hypothetical protein